MQIDLSIFSTKAKPLIGLDISSSAVKMVELSGGGKGVILVETAEGKFKIVGQRGAGATDAAGAQRYAQFVDLKSRIIAFTESGLTETPLGGGSAAPVRVDAR